MWKSSKIKLSNNEIIPLFALFMQYYLKTAWNAGQSSEVRNGKSKIHWDPKILLWKSLTGSNIGKAFQDFKIGSTVSKTRHLSMDERGSQKQRVIELSENQTGGQKEKSGDYWFCLWLHCLWCTWD